MLRRLAMSLLLRLSTRMSIEGLDVYMLARGEQRQEAARTLHAALQLIIRYDRTRYERMRRDLVGILVLPHASTPGAIHEDIRICSLDASQMRGDKSGLASALLLVHEATHARLGKMGFRARTVGVRRVEAVCALAEYLFLLRVPSFTNRDTILERARQKVDIGRQDSRRKRRGSEQATIM